MGLRKILLLCLLYFKYSESTDDYDDYDEQCSGDESGVAPWVDDDILIMQTMDGKVHAVEKRTGNTKWSAELDKNWFPLTNEDGQKQSGEMGFSFLPDPSDGSIYTYDGGRLTKLPLTIPQMVERSPTRSPADNTVYIGDKKDNWFIIDKQSGIVKRKITPNGSENSKAEDFRMDDIYVGYTDYTLTMFDAKTNDVKWNLTYSELKDIGSANTGRDHLWLDVDVSTSTGDVIIHGFEGSATGRTIFKSRCNLGFPVIGVFSSTQLGLKRHQFKTYSPDHFSTGKGRKNNAEDMKSLVYIGLHFNHPYAVCSYSDSSKIIASDNEPDEPDPTTKWDLIGYHEVTEASPSTANLLPAAEDEGLGEACWANDPTGQNCNIPPTKSTVIEMEKESQGNRVQQTTPQNITQGQIVEIAVNTISNVKFLQALVVLLVFALIISFAWKTAIDEKLTKIGKIEFDPEELLGKGCQGTSVFRGTFDGRDVAVKRMLSDSFALAEREIKLLRQAEHPNLLRYYCNENDKMFIYIALELCHCDLDSFVQNRQRFELTDNQVMYQCALGLEQLHSLGVIHRDIKPSNILITYPKRNQKPRAVIADFGLCRQMEQGRGSVSVTGLHGTEGWAAPEVFQRNRSVTCAVDIFSLGCVYYFCLSGGKHPYGAEFFMRQAKIHQGRFELDNIDPCESELISRMIQKDAPSRITIDGVLKHPVFWEKEKILRFLSETSDCLEREDLDSKILVYLEMYKHAIGGSDWKLRLATALQEDLRKFRTYGDNIKDLLRAIRNKRHHHRDLTPEAQNELGTGPESFWEYFDDRYPLLLSTSYKIMSILYTQTADVNFKEFYDPESACVSAKLVLEELEAMSKSDRLADESVIKNFGIKPNISLSPKLQRVTEYEEGMPFSHKIKTKMIWQEKATKNKRYNKTPDRLEPSQCILLDGSVIEIGREIPIRAGEDIQSPEMVRELFPTFLRLFESIQEEKERNKRNKEEREARLEAEKELLARSSGEILLNEVDKSATPSLADGLSLLGRGVQFFARQFSENLGEHNPAVDICEQLLKDDLDENSKEMPFSRDPTPPPFIIPNNEPIRESYVAKSIENIIANTSQDDNLPEKSDALTGESENEENALIPNHKNERKKPNRRKRKKAKK